MKTTKQNFYSKEYIERIKTECKIVDYLSCHGYEPVKCYGSEWLYSSIGANERTPSFFVNVKKNVYYDYSGNSDTTGEKGDIIRLVQSLEHCTFLDACYKLANAEFMPLSFTPPTPPEQKKGIEIIKVNCLRTWPLINYIESRRIGFSLADRYVREVHYMNAGSKFVALGFKNDKEGYALRSANFKGQTMPQGFTTLAGLQSDTINVFEGFFSMLSCLEFFECQCFKNHTTVLNSLSNLNSWIPQITESVKTINVFFDNDPAGQKALKKLQDLNKWEIKPQNKLYDGYKDFNEFLCNS
ncbi:toprim domain-containing protein [Emticicia sp. W12TSBA100-4]|uniref:toprim domain-containing protein n=1 Tax=Emticicia sp. W12TSBA100-4 TaxID=3160965 RepID=UPI0033055F1C